MYVNGSPVTVPRYPEGSRKLRFPDYMTMHRIVVGCQPYVSVAFTPRKCSWYSFPLEAESTPSP